MKRMTSFLSASTFLVAAAFALPASAQQVGAAPQPAPVPTPTPPVAAQATPTTPSTPSTPSTPPTPITSTTTTTAADTASDTTAGPMAPEPRERDTITVTRSLFPNRPWLITGGAILAGTYVTTAVLASTEGRTVEDRNLLIPVVGPWLNLNDRRCDGCDNESGNIALVIGSGVLQGIGAGMAIMSFFIPEKIEAATIQAGPLKMNVTPWQVGRSGMGLGTVGVF